MKQYIVSEEQLQKTVSEAILEMDVEGLRSYQYNPQAEPNKVLDELYPPNTHIEKNGDLYGGWEIDPKSLIRLKRYIQSNPQYEEEPDMEVIEVVIRAIKHELKYGKVKSRTVAKDGE